MQNSKFKVQSSRFNLPCFARFVSFVVIFSACLSAETVVLKNGKRITGDITSTGGHVVQLNADGISMQIEKSQIASIEFSGGGAPAASAPPMTYPAQPPQQAYTPQTLTLPAGTPILVTLGQTLSSGSTRAGEMFRGTVVADVRAGNQVVIPAGSMAEGRVASASRASRGVRKEPGALNLELTAVNANGRMIPVATSTHQMSGQQQQGSVLKGAARGAAAGSIFGAIKGDKVGQSAGAGAGAGAALGFVSPGEELTLQAGSVLTFPLRAPVSL